MKRPCRTVAQPGSAFAWGAKGHEFKSRRSDQFSAIFRGISPFLLRCWCVKEANERLQRLDRLRVEEERLEPHEGDAVVVHVRRAVEVGIDDDSPEPVVEMSQGVRFLCELVFARNCVGRLNLYSAVELAG